MGVTTRGEAVGRQRAGSGDGHPDNRRVEWQIEVRDPIQGARCYAAVVLDERGQIVLVGPPHISGGAFLFNGAALRQLAAALDEAESVVAAREARHA